MSKGVIEIKGKNLELPFNPHFIYEEFTSLLLIGRITSIEID